MPDIVLEVRTRTDFADSFTQVNERGARVADFQISLAAVLVAQSCNIGFEPMVRPDIPALHRDRLSWVSQDFIRNETLRAANAKLVASHDTLPIVRLWGSGDVASADGVRFIVRGQPIHAGYNLKYLEAQDSVGSNGETSLRLKGERGGRGRRLDIQPALSAMLTPRNLVLPCRVAVLAHDRADLRSHTQPPSAT